MSNSYAAIGDVHGRFDLLVSLIEKVRLAHQFNEDCAPGSDKRFVMLGDYIDRGPSSSDVIDWLIRHQAGMVILPGNHELMMAEALHPSARGSARVRFDSWVSNGGDQTIRSYLTRCGKAESAEIIDLLIAEGPDAVIAIIPKEHRDFINHLAFESPPYHLDEERKLLFVHAGVRPHKSLRGHTREELLWSRDPAFLGARDPGWAEGWRVVHGHSIEWEPKILPHRIGIDTGAFLTDKLSCAVFKPSQDVVTLTT
jgi:serine/threonine protein phosphatase 1